MPSGEVSAALLIRKEIRMNSFPIDVTLQKEICNLVSEQAELIALAKA
jgi:hypothetical protein